MKEKQENSFIEDDSLKEIKTLNNDINKFREVLESKQYLLVNINKFDQKSININISSFYKIGKMIQVYPEENICFLINKTELYTPRRSLSFTNSSILSNKDGESSFSDIKLQSSNKKSTKEEIINTDIVKPNTIAVSKLNNIINLNNDENIDNIKIEDEKIVNKINNNIKNMQIFSTRNNISDKRVSVKNKKIMKTSSDKKLVLFKWLYHYYIISSIIILCHYFTFIFSEYNYAIFYKLITFILIISLALVGYIGIKYKYTKAPFFIFNDGYIFWVHFFILILTIFTFSALLTAGGHFKFISSQGVLGYFITFIYIISLIIEGIYCLYYDLIIDEINWDRNNNKMNTINEYIDNNLNIQLTEID